MEHKKFSQRLTHTQKRRFQRQRAVERKEKEKQVLDQVMQEVEPVNKSKFRRKTTEDPITSKEESLAPQVPKRLTLRVAWS